MHTLTGGAGKERESWPDRGCGRSVQPRGPHRAVPAGVIATRPGAGGVMALFGWQGAREAPRCISGAGCGSVLTRGRVGPAGEQRGNTMTVLRRSRRLAQARGVVILRSHVAAGWGDNGEGQLGDGTLTSRSGYGDVRVGNDVVQVA